MHSILKHPVDAQVEVRFVEWLLQSIREEQKYDKQEAFHSTFRGLAIPIDKRGTTSVEFIADWRLEQSNT